MAQTRDCPARPPANSIVTNPLDLAAHNGVLRVDLMLRSRQMLELPLKVCYVYDAGPQAVEAPTLRLNPGDELQVDLTNRFAYVRPHSHPAPPSPAPHDPCAGGVTATTSTNIDFQGLHIPPDCHSGDVSVTTIENTDPAFEYKFQIPKDHPPGMYWYHPHRQGSATLQLNGGASGILIVNGMERAKPEVAGLPERILVIRQTFEEDDPESWPPGESRLSLNFQPAVSPHLPSPVIQMKPGAREFWRVANATSQAFLALQVVFGKNAREMKLVALDGAPLKRSLDLRTIELPPGGRAEFILTAPAAGQPARLLKTEVETGRTGLEDSAQELARIVATADAQDPPAMPVGIARPAEPARDGNADVSLAAAHATAVRKLYFAEATQGTNGPTRFFLTAEGQKVSSPSSTPTVVTQVGAVEDWTLANHTGELHTFHMHGRHFLVLQVNGKPLPYPEVRDTMTIPAWGGAGPYPTVRVRLDFRDPRAAGTFIFHCGILHHAEAGMIAKIQVRP